MKNQGKYSRDLSVHYRASHRKRTHQQFDQLEATSLFCPHCRKAVPVRKRLLLALPDGDKYDYLCVYCGNSAGTKIERGEVPVKLIL